MFIKKFESWYGHRFSDNSKVESLLIEASKFIKSIKYIIEDIEHQFENGSRVEIKLILENNRHGYIPQKYHPSGVKLDISGFINMKVIISYDDMQPRKKFFKSISPEEFFESDHYLEFVDRVESYCDQNGYITYLDDSKRSWKIIYVGVGKPKI